jgi:hypothetical protein
VNRRSAVCAGRVGVGGLLGGGIEKDPQPMTAFLVEMLSE